MIALLDLIVSLAINIVVETSSKIAVGILKLFLYNKLIGF